ncbi:MAG: hypothetical protein DRR08_10990 [Candidatus Parabeggiatoa sp. nov. 2]|nr:MAG: hypothetical protein B6247_27010 [Beggiatoa sp. 4572_84]RKZ60570.1 MAG: hypothetical protein DRR08_10990 [Gammaproteobacteria bacterium]
MLLGNEYKLRMKNEKTRKAQQRGVVCFSRLELLAWGFIPRRDFGLTIKNWRDFGLTIKNVIIEL